MIAITPATQEMLNQLLKLSAPERIAVAQALWDSLPDPDQLPNVHDDPEFVAELMRRDAEMDAGINVMTHEEFMTAVRRDLKMQRAQDDP